MKRIDDQLMAQCDEWLEKRAIKRGLPQDFDDVTWVMHDFVLFLRSKDKPSGPTGET